MRPPWRDPTHDIGPMIIAQLTDTHLRAKDAGDAEGTARAEGLRRCVAHIGTRSPRPGIVIHTGDMTERGRPAEFAHAREILDALGVPLYVVPGNRDGRDAMRRAFADHGYLPGGDGFLSYVVEDYPVRIVALDSLDAGSPMGEVCETRLAWLQRTLAREPARPTILAMHHPPFEVATDHPFAFHARADAEALSRVVSRHAQVVRVLCGHVHRPGTVAWGGTVGSTAPCVAGDLRKGPLLRSPDGAPVHEAPVYELHTVDAKGRLASAMQVVRAA